jgi:hypothetical protein
MGKLNPGKTYVYEKSNGIVYARELGAKPETRIEIGWDYDSRTKDGRPLIDHIRESKLWGDIHREAENNITLRRALEQCIIIYELSRKEDGA